MGGGERGEKEDWGSGVVEFWRGGAARGGRLSIVEDEEDASWTLLNAVCWDEKERKEGGNGEEEEETAAGLAAK